MVDVAVVVAVLVWLVCGIGVVAVVVAEVIAVVVTEVVAVMLAEVVAVVVAVVRQFRSSTLETTSSLATLFK